MIIIILKYIMKFKAAMGRGFGMVKVVRSMKMRIYINRSKALILNKSLY